MVVVVEGPGAGEPSDALCQPWFDVDSIGECDDCGGGDVGRWADYASFVLYQLTGRRYRGVCSDTLRPCGRLSRSSGCGCRSSVSCGCSTLSEIRLPGPVVSVDEVKLDGDVLTPSVDYRLDGTRTLVALGEVTWPCCQDIEADDDEENTFSVTLQWGAAPPPGGPEVAAALACELARACDPDQQCRLPSRIQSIVRQGETIVVLDPLDLFEKGRTGIPEVDLWVGSINRGRATRRARVIDLARPPRFRRTGA